MRATGGFRFVSGIDVLGNPTTGCEIAAGGGSINCTSDRNVKANFAAIDGLDVLELVSRLSIESWNYKTHDPSIRHIGPMAQDFYATFGVGDDERRIGNIDADGVALAAIQGLNLLVQEKDAEVVALSDRVAALEASRTSSWALPVSLSGQIAWLAFGLMTIAAVLGWTRRQRGAGDRE